MFFQSDVSGNPRGFSLIEIVVSLAIITLVTTLVMVRFGSFNSSIILKNQAFELALDTREAQVFSVSVRGSQNEFREEYGIYVDVDQPSHYIFWLDDSSNNGGVEPVLPAFNASPNDETIRVRTLDPRFSIVEICINTDSNCDVEEVHISFARPNFDAKIRAVTDSGTSAAQDVRITLAANNDLTFTRSVVVTQSGQITVE